MDFCFTTFNVSFFIHPPCNFTALVQMNRLDPLADPPALTESDLEVLLVFGSAAYTMLIGNWFHIFT